MPESRGYWRWVLHAPVYAAAAALCITIAARSTNLIPRRVPHSLGAGARTDFSTLGDDRVYLSVGDGRLQVHRAADGSALCSVQVARHFDHGCRARRRRAHLCHDRSGRDLAAAEALDSCDTAAIIAAFGGAPGSERAASGGADHEDRH